MTLFDYISDIHLGFYAKNIQDVKPFITSLVPNDPSPTLIIAGDISELNSYIIETLETFSEYYTHVIFVWGNHDLYLLSNKQKVKYSNQSDNRKNELKKYFSNNSKVYLLDNKTITIGEVDFTGSSNWYSIERPEDFQFWLSMSNDSTYIIPRTYESNQRRHDKDKSFLIQKKDEMEKSRNKQILITHVPPIHIPMNPNTPSGCYYYMNYEYPAPDYWVAGHQHTPYTGVLGNTQLLINPYGYPGEVESPGIKTCSM